MRLKYEWRATFEDGEVIDEYLKEEKTSRDIRQIFKKPLRQFQLIEVKTGKPKITVHVRPGMKIIHRRRWTHKFGIQGDKIVDQVRTPVWIVGWHERRLAEGFESIPRKILKNLDDSLKYVNLQMIAFVFLDGTVELLNKWRDDAVLYHPVKLLPEEMLP